jgi:hypothetical protein
MGYHHVVARHGVATPRVPGGPTIVRYSGKRHPTLSQYLAERRQEAEDGRVGHETRPFSSVDIKRLDSLASCSCPACMRRRRETGEVQGLQGGGMGPKEGNGA